MLFFKNPFAKSGDKTAIPTDAQPGGEVSYEDGFGADYELDQETDPNAKDVPREETNSLYFEITENIRQWQTFGIYPYITAAQNGGVAFPYAKNAKVVYNNEVYESLVNSNTGTPDSAPNDWELVSGKYTQVVVNENDLRALEDQVNRSNLLNMRIIETDPTITEIYDVAVSGESGGAIFCCDDGDILRLGNGANGLVQDTTPVSDDLQTIHYHNNTAGFVAAGLNGAVIQSPTGGAWNNVTIGGYGGNWLTCFGSSVMPNPNRYVLSGSNGGTAYSDDGVNWTLNPALGTAVLVGGVVFTDEDQTTGIYVLYSGELIYTGTDGINWNLEVTLAGSNVRGVTYSPTLDLWAVVTSEGEIFTGDALNNLTLRLDRPGLEGLFAVEWGGNQYGINERFVASGDVSANNIGIFYSDDGINWIAAPRRTVTESALFATIAYNRNRRLYMAVGNADILVSSDGINWRESNVVGFENPVGASSGRFCRVGDQIAFTDDLTGNIIISEMTFIKDSF